MEVPLQSSRLRRGHYLTRSTSGPFLPESNYCNTTLETNKQTFVEAFAGRADFLARYPQSLTAAQFVDALNANTGGSLSAAERDALVAQLSADPGMRAQVLRAVVDDEDFQRREFNKAFVLMQYFGYLRRNPDDAPDTDFTGYNFWLKKLEDFGGNYVAAEMVKAFITSTEYTERFAPKPGEVKQVLAFVGAGVVPTDRDRVLTDQTVIVRDGRITQITPSAQTTVPSDALRIDARGKFITPGLADMHIHLQGGTGQTGDAADQQLKLLLANGVTTVRGMFGAPSHLILRSRVASGEVMGPTIYAAGPIFHGSEIPSAAFAEQKVQEQKAAGYDFIKVHEQLTPLIYEAIVAKAREVGIPVGGHVTAGVGLGRALVARQSSIEHLDRYIASTVADQFAAQVPPNQIFFGEFLRHIDDDKLRVVARDTRDAGVANTPTLGLFSLIASLEQVSALLQLPEMRYVSAGTRNGFAQQRQGTLNAIAANGITQDDLNAFVAARGKITRGLHEAGAVGFWRVRTRRSTSSSRASRSTASCARSSRRGSRLTKHS